MHDAAYGLAGALAVAIIFLGAQYVATPWATTRSFGMARPANDGVTASWLRLKGVRDIASGLAVLALMVWGGPKMAGLILIVEALIPLGDMSVIRRRTARRRALSGSMA